MRLPTQLQIRELLSLLADTTEPRPPRLPQAGRQRVPAPDRGAPQSLGFSPVPQAEPRENPSALLHLQSIFPNPPSARLQTEGRGCGDMTRASPECALNQHAPLSSFPGPRHHNQCTFCYLCFERWRARGRERAATRGARKRPFASLRNVLMHLAKSGGRAGAARSSPQTERGPAARYLSLCQHLPRGKPPGPFVTLLQP